MKRRLGLMMAMAATALVGSACSKDAQAPAEPAKVEAPVEKAPTAPAETPAVEAAPAAEAKTAPAAEAKTAPGGAAHEGCAEHAAAADDGEKDCPFPDEKAAAAIEGCGAHAAVEPAKNADGSLHFGSTFALTEAKPLASVLGGASDGQELNVRVSGQIDKVCQKKGCWMVVRDGEVEARVVMKDHAFTVPVDSKGKPAQVEGVLKVRVFTEAQAKHLAEDGGEDPSKVQGEKKELLLTATAVEIGG
jgi:hypothetical protein